MALVCTLVMVISIMLTGCGGGGGSSVTVTEPASTSTPSPSDTPAPTSTGTPTPAPSPEVVEVDCNTLYNDYTDNPINADKLYRNKTLKLTGTISDIGRAVTEETYVLFRAGKNGEVHITFEKSEEDKVANLKKGQSITVTGFCYGLLLGDVALGHCHIVE